MESRGVPVKDAAGGRDAAGEGRDKVGGRDGVGVKCQGKSLTLALYPDPKNHDPKNHEMADGSRVPCVLALL